MYDDAELVGRLQRNDPFVRERLVKYYVPSIENYVKRYVKYSKYSNKDISVEDIVQDILLDLFANEARLLRLYEPQKNISLRSWILLHARRRVADIMRKSRRRAALMLHADVDVDTVVVAHPQDDLDAEKVVYENEIKKIIIASLLREDYELLMLVNDDDEDYGSIAMKYSMSSDALRQRICRMRRKLREILAVDGR